MQYVRSGSEDGEGVWMFETVNELLDAGNTVARLSCMEDLLFALETYLVD